MKRFLPLLLLPALALADGPQVVADPRFDRHRHRGPLNRSTP